MVIDIRLIAFDLDWSAMNSQKIISNRTWQAIDRAVTAGKYLVPATGRMNLKRFPEGLLDNRGIPYVIMNNGAKIISLPSQEIVFSRSFEKNTVLTLLDECRSFKGLIIVSGDLGSAIDDKGDAWKDDKFMAFYRNRRQKGSSELKDIEQLIGKENVETNKITLIFADRDEKEKALNSLRHHHDISVTTSAPNNIEMMPLGVNKGKALNFVANDL
jgi:hydroxymethylpyrimidine pyrophosphatase-like HAD family hydrolase